MGLEAILKWKPHCLITVYLNILLEDFEMEESMYITNVVKTIKRYLWLIILIAIIGGIIGKFVASSGAAPSYQASSLVLIEKLSKQNLIINQSDDNSRFLNTAQTFINTSTILEPVIKDLNLDEKVSDLSSNVTVTNENNSQLLQITVEDKNARTATKIANKITDVFVKTVPNYLDVSNLKVMEKAQYGDETKDVHTRAKADIAMGVIIGLILGVILAFILSAFRPAK